MSAVTTIANEYGSFLTIRIKNGKTSLDWTNPTNNSSSIISNTINLDQFTFIVDMIPKDESYMFIKHLHSNAFLGATENNDIITTNIQSLDNDYKWILERIVDETGNIYFKIQSFHESYMYVDTNENLRWTKSQHIGSLFRFASDFDCLNVEEIECCICKEPETYEGNDILICDGNGCNIAVHQICYGVSEIPSGAWYCEICSHKKSNKKLLVDSITCDFCSNIGGAFRLTDKKTWVHSLCYNWNPEVNKKRRIQLGLKSSNPIDEEIQCKSYASLIKPRKALTCQICFEAGGSACNLCDYKYPKTVNRQCDSAYHPWCLLNQKNTFKRRLLKSSRRTHWEVFCTKHVMEINNIPKDHTIVSIEK